eukprot:466403_1
MSFFNKEAFDRDDDSDYGEMQNVHDSANGPKKQFKSRNKKVNAISFNKTKKGMKSNVKSYKVGVPKSISSVNTNSTRKRKPKIKKRYTYGTAPKNHTKVQQPKLPQRITKVLEINLRKLYIETETKSRFKTLSARLNKDTNGDSCCVLCILPSIHAKKLTVFQDDTCKRILGSKCISKWIVENGGVLFQKWNQYKIQNEKNLKIVEEAVTKELEELTACNAATKSEIDNLQREIEMIQADNCNNFNNSNNSNSAHL